jgi:hypothetical protein
VACTAVSPAFFPLFLPMKKRSPAIASRPSSLSVRESNDNVLNKIVDNERVGRQIILDLYSLTYAIYL